MRDRAHAVVFDLDETLLDQSSAADAAVIAWAADLGVEDADIAQRWSLISNGHYARYQTREISFEGQRRERMREFLGRQLTDEHARAAVQWSSSPTVNAHNSRDF
ncbi:hypothetical protein [Microbacterium sp. AK031]|uniref:hypothetical protein n=1 Tax=Microbacterium sp. AK031 TaxID=2723076 RepID=UPI002166E015|nr:hypothetical protein [Microbacterium sp. AK031]MCS3842731.1 FMN phosphatase YigB (HAD superfamily) [Microbacterium sp. AK031]